MNLAQILEGPATILYKGQYFHTAGMLGVHFTQESFPIPSAAYGPIGQRARQGSVVLNFQPVGEFDADLVPILWPWRNPRIGQLITPVTSWYYSGVSTITNQIAIVAHGILAGMPAMVGTFGTLPSGLDDSTLYYIGAPDADHVSFHLTQADAIANTSLVALGSAGTEVSQLVEQEPLVVHTLQGNRVTFPVAAVSGMPEIQFSALETIMGGLTIECFRTNNASWSDVDSLYAVDYASYSYPGPDKSKIKTQGYTCAWGAVAPFDSFYCRGPVRARFNLGLSPYETDNLGILSRKITSLTATISGVPAGMSEEQLALYLDQQGAGAGRGVERTANDFVISGADAAVFARFYDAALTDVPEQFDATGPRSGQLTWQTSRKFTGAGVVRPVFDIGVSAPSS
jgi:hypothetical protein